MCFIIKFYFIIEFFLKKLSVFPLFYPQCNNFAADRYFDGETAEVIE